MKKTSYLNRWLVFICVILSCFIVTPRSANADTLGMLGQILDLIHPADPNEIPSGSELTGMVGLINCVVDNPDNAPSCISQYSSALQGNNYGDTIVTIAQLYVDVDNKDVWGIVGIVAKWLGDDAPCIIAGIVLPGVGDSLCELVKEIVGFLKDIGEAILDFFTDIGDAIICTFKKCCIGGQALYNRQTGYAPYENDGLKWLEDPAKNLTEDTFWNNEVTLSNWVCDANEDACLVDLQNAQNAFIAVVNKKWDADMITNVLPNFVTPARNSYLSKIPNLAAQAIAATASSGNPKQWIINRCTDDFSQYTYYDRWVKNTNNKAESGMNASWCSGTFWGKNESKFSKEFGKYVNQNLCPNFLCGTAANYQACSRIQSSLSYPDWGCAIDKVKMGKDIAPIINNLLHQPAPSGDGSQISCSVNNDSIICQRGTQQLFCGERYKKYAHDNLNFVLSQLQGEPLVNCATPVEQGSYLDIHNKLKALYATPGSPFYGLTGDKIDPMRVAYIEALTPYSDKNANPQLIASLQNDPNYKALGFVTKNCKAGDYTVDGEPQPTICTQSPKPPVTTPGGSAKERLKQEYEDLKSGGFRHPDPENQLSSNTALSSSPVNAQNSLGAGTADSPKLPGAFQSSVARKSMLAGSAIQGTESGQGQTQAMTLELLPDITAGGQVTIGDKIVLWNSTVNLDAKNASKSANGVCTFSVQYSVSNIGKVPTGAFESTWINKALNATWDRQWPGILPGSSATQKDAISLKPGENRLTLSLDPKNQVKESNKDNNQFYLQAVVTGTCSGLPSPANITVPLRKK